MRLIAAAALLLAGAVAFDCSCTPAKSPDTQARAIARGTVETLETVWDTAATACMAVANAKEDQAIANSCKEYLAPARTAIVAAADAVDVWDDAAQGNFPCLIASAIDGVNQGLGVAEQVGFKPPQVVLDGRVLANQYVPLCQDGGK